MCAYCMLPSSATVASLRSIHQDGETVLSPGADASCERKLAVVPKACQPRTTAGELARAGSVSAIASAPMNPTNVLFPRPTAALRTRPTEEGYGRRAPGVAL